jgi:hypothetical protein
VKTLLDYIRECEEEEIQQFKKYKETYKNNVDPENLEELNKIINNIYNEVIYIREDIENIRDNIIPKIKYDWEVPVISIIIDNLLAKVLLKE